MKLDMNLNVLPDDCYLLARRKFTSLITELGDIKLIAKAVGPVYIADKVELAIKGIFDFLRDFPADGDCGPPCRRSSCRMRW